MVAFLSSSLLSDPVTRVLLTVLLPLLAGFGIGVFAARRHLDWVLSSLRTVRLARRQGNREAMLRSLGSILGEVAGLFALVAVLMSVTRQFSRLDGVPGIRGVPVWLAVGLLAALALYAMQYRQLERRADDAVASTPPTAATGTAAHVAEGFVAHGPSDPDPAPSPLDPTPADSAPADLAQEVAPAVASDYAGFTNPFAPHSPAQPANPAPSTPIPSSPPSDLRTDVPDTVFLTPPGASAGDLFAPSPQAVDAAARKARPLPALPLSEGILTIRQATPADAALLCGWWNDGAVMAHAGFPQGLGTTPEVVAASLAEDDVTRLRLILEAAGRPIGEMSTRRIDEGVTEIGIKICDVPMQERGYGTRYLKILIDWLFCAEGTQKVVLDTNLANTRAQHVYEKLGFVRLRTRVDAWTDQVGQPQSAVDYELTRTVWESRPSS